MWYMRQKEEFGEDRSQGIRFYDNTQTCDYLPHWHMTYAVSYTHLTLPTKLCV